MSHARRNWKHWVAKKKIINDDDRFHLSILLVTSRPCLADRDEFGLQARPTHEESVNVGLFGQVLAVLFVDRAAVLDTGGSGNFRRHVVSKPFTDVAVDFLGLRGNGQRPITLSSCQMKQTCSGVATLPVPIAQTGSYAITMSFQLP